MGNASNLLLPGATCQDLLACVLDLNELERYVYLCLLGQPEHSLDDLAAHLKRERSTIHRAVNKLVGLGIVAKENRGIEGGGYYQAYKPAPPEVVATLVRDRFRAIQEKVESLTRTFPVDTQRMAANVGAKAHRRRQA